MNYEEIQSMGESKFGNLATKISQLQWKQIFSII